MFSEGEETREYCFQAIMFPKLGEPGDIIPWPFLYKPGKTLHQETKYAPAFVGKCFALCWNTNFISANIIKKHSRKRSEF